jgi:hypothetical protein
MPKRYLFILLALMDSWAPLPALVGTCFAIAGHRMPTYVMFTPKIVET